MNQFFKISQKLFLNIETLWDLLFFPNDRYTNVQEESSGQPASASVSAPVRTCIERPAAPGLSNEPLDPDAPATSVLLVSSNSSTCLPASAVNRNSYSPTDSRVRSRATRAPR